METCPICFKDFQLTELESHVNKCIFLNSSDANGNPKKKRSISPPASTFPSQSSSSASPVKKQRNRSPNADKAMSFVTPLAKQVQPRSLDDFFGQNHVLGKDTVLRSLLAKREIPNMILWGPPGCGKTSLANVVQEICKENPSKFRYVGMCAANCGVKEVQAIVTAAKGDLKFGRRTVLFMDEIHRFNKRQQDTFLLHVEKGEITLLGATTENPSFSINNALLSRCRVIVMEKLESVDLVSILENAAGRLGIRIVQNGAECEGINIEKSALEWLADTSDGDARIALSNLQLVLQHNTDENVLVTVDMIKDGIKKSHMLYDRKGEEHYNIISAMHKSIRGSDDNAALYWTTRMIVSGEDPLFIARRLVRAASEDIGNADPRALQLAVSTMQGCQLLGMPEADVLLAQCAIYLARAPKSREADSALAGAKQLIANCKGPQPSVPMHLRNAPTKLMQDLGYGKLELGKKRTYMPAGLENANFF
uniref:AAA+ ATPase domain-containing protein n=1 Tax=Photinus pyralis TaxID=7054 RepID=A0A1Y1KPP1_PHOPY